MSNIVVIGTGAIGQLIACELALYSNANVKVIETRQHIPVKNARTIAFTHYHGLSHQLSIPIAEPKELNDADIIIVAVKAFHVSEVLCAYQQWLNPNTLILLCHNGLGSHEQLIANDFTHQKLGFLLTTHGAFRPTKYHVIHTGLGHYDLGLSTTAVNDEIAKNQQEQLSKYLPNTTIHQDISIIQWRKLAINCVINPITAINNMTNGQVLNAKYHQLIAKLAEEISTVAQYRGIKLSTSELVNVVNNVAQATAKNQSSMLCDVKASRETEVDYINGYIVKLANEAGISVPYNEQLWQQVKAH